MVEELTEGRGLVYSPFSLCQQYRIDSIFKRYKFVIRRSVFDIRYLLFHSKLYDDFRISIGKYGISKFSFPFHLLFLPSPKTIY